MSLYDNCFHVILKIHVSIALIIMSDIYGAKCGRRILTRYYFRLLSVVAVLVRYAALFGS